MRIKWLIIVAGLAIVLAVACTSDRNTGTPVATNPSVTDTPTPTVTDTPDASKLKGVLSGSVKIGPLCPVEPCSQGIGDTYESRRLELQPEAADGISISLRRDGTFDAIVPVGKYVVTVSDCEFLGCTFSLPVTVEIKGGETFHLDIDIDTGIRSVVQSPGELPRLADELRSAGAEVEPGSDIRQPFFSVPGRVLTVNGSDVQIFEYPNIEAAQAEASTVAPDGSSIGTTMISWVATPHFYMSGTLIVLYVGEDPALQRLLEKVAGKVVVPTPGIPRWLTDLIQRLENDPVANPPASVTQYNYKSQIVYFVPQRCCDIFSDLYAADGNIIAQPDGGISGQGDGRALDFFEERENERLIWEDKRQDAPDSVQVLAPIESVELNIAESFPLQYFLAVVSGLPNSCHTFGGYTVTRNGTDVRVRVLNLRPAETGIICA